MNNLTMRLCPAGIILQRVKEKRGKEGGVHKEEGGQEVS